MANKFIENAIAKQNSAYSANFAKKQFNYSCEMCATRGIFREECDSCPIHEAHKKALKEIAEHKRENPNKRVIKSSDGTTVNVYVYGNNTTLVVKF